MVEYEGNEIWTQALKPANDIQDFLVVKSSCKQSKNMALCYKKMEM